MLYFVSFLMFAGAFTNGHQDTNRSVMSSLACSRVNDSLVLVQFYEATDGANWNVKWNLDRPIHEWTGVLLNPNGCVQSLILINNNLVGNIPPVLGQLSALNIFYLFGNKLEGSIPPQLGQLSNLEELVLEDNQISGKIPSELALCSRLRYLSLAKNNLTGGIPSALSNLDTLGVLNLNSNMLSGTIPSQIGLLNRLNILDLGNNNFEGSLPFEISLLTELRELYLHNNSLSGSMPSDMSQLDKMIHLWAFNNQFTGRVPDLTAAPLNSLRIEFNRFEDIPNYSLVNTWSSSFPFGLIIHHNQFTFEDLIPLNGIHRRFNYEFIPQNPIPIDSILFVESGTNYLITTGVDPGITENNFKWFRDTSLVFISNNNSFQIIQASAKDEGYYTGEVTNPAIPGFQLQIAQFRVIVFDPLSCDIPIAGTSCKDALAFCSTSQMNNYCGSLGPIDTSLKYLLCDSFRVYNPRWISFVAPTDSILLEIFPINCTGVEENGILYKGIQLSVWQSCGGREDSVLICRTDCQEGPIVVNEIVFTKGQTYSIVLNGCHGDNCSYLIKVKKGNQTFELAEPGPISGNMVICPDTAEHRFTVPDIVGATSFRWFLNNNFFSETADTALNLKNLAPGMYSLKVQAINFCDTTEFSSFQFEVPPQLSLNEIKRIRINNDSAYQISFEIQGGVKPFTVSKGRGNIDPVSNKFNSDTLLCKSAYEFEISDAHGCKILYSGFEDCGCTSLAGRMPADSLQICEGQSFSVSFIGPETIDTGDISNYILFTDPLNPGGSILKTNDLGLFPFDPSRFRFGIWYYISRVIGKPNAKNEINFNHPCVSISNFQPVIFRPKPLVSAGPNLSFCGFEGQLSSFGNHTSGVWRMVVGPASVHFTDPDKDQTKVIVPLLGTYRFVREVTNGFCTNKDEVEVIFTEALKPQISGGLFVCPGQETQLRSESEYFKYQWNTGDTTRSILISNPGEYCLTVSDEESCTGKICVNIDSSVAPVATLFAPDSLCTGNKGIIRLSEIYQKYMWSTGDTTTSIQIDTGGQYCVRVTASNGCTDEACVEVGSKERSYTFLHDTVCFGESYFIFGKTLLQNGRHIIPTGAQGSNGCDSAVVFDLFWWPQIIAEDTIIFKDDGSGSGAIEVSIKGGKGPYRYLWSNGGRSSKIINLKSGTYFLFVTDEHNCQETFEFFVPMITGTDDKVKNDKSGFVLIPNPVGSQQKFKLINNTKETEIDIQLFNVDGKDIGSWYWHSYGAGDSKEFVLNLHSGFYIFKINKSNGTSVYIQFIVL